jgi:hypothetical protein
MYSGQDHYIVCPLSQHRLYKPVRALRPEAWWPHFTRTLVHMITHQCTQHWPHVQFHGTQCSLSTVGQARCGRVARTKRASYDILRILQRVPDIAVC